MAAQKDGPDPTSDAPARGAIPSEAAAVPAGFRLRFDPEVRRPRPEVLIGGAPLRVLRLSGAGAALIDSWMAGRPVGSGRGAGRLAARLVDAAMAHPVPPPDGTAPTCAVVIPVRDDPAGLAATLAALADTAGGNPVLVVDDGSLPPVTGGRDGVRVVRRPLAGGPAAARNAGWRALGAGSPGAHPEVVLFVDAGCAPQPGWLAPLLAHFSDPAVAAVAPRVASRPGPATPPMLAAYEAVHSPLDMGERPAPVGPGSAVPYVPTAVLAVRRSVLADVGGFDDRLRFGEDVDLVWRLRESGHRIRYEPGALATHPARRSYAAWASQRFQYGRSAAPLASRHGPAVAPLAVQPWSVAAWGLAATGHPLLGSAVAAGTAWTLARRAAGDPIVAAELRRLAATGNLRAGGAIATAIRRAWLPPALAAGSLAWCVGGRRTRVSLLLTAAAVMSGPVRGRARGAGPVAMAVLGLADDLAYQAGVWDGVVRAHSPAALLPRW